MTCVLIRHNNFSDFYLRTWIKTLAKKRECRHAEKNRERKRGERERERESFVIDYILLRKLLGNGKVQPRHFPSRTIRSRRNWRFSNGKKGWTKAIVVNGVDKRCYSSDISSHFPTQCKSFPYFVSERFRYIKKIDNFV